MAVTLEDVAQRSGYSQATISRVVNNSAGVSPEVRAAVEKAIKELGYLTRRSRGPGAEQVVEVILHRTGFVERIEAGPQGVSVGPVTPAVAETMLTPDWQLGNNFHLRLLNGILAELKGRGGKALLQVANDLNDPALVDGLRGGSAPVLLVGEGGPQLSKLIADCRRPLVLVDMLDVTGAHEQVTTDNLAGIGLAVEHLASLGHVRIGYIGGSDVPPNRERANAFAYHVHRNRLEVVPDWQEVAYESVEGTTERLVGLLGRGQRPTGVVCCNDWGALALERAAARVGLSIPKHISVVGFDDAAMAAMANPPLTSVHVECEDIGRMGVRLLLSQRAGEGRGCTVRLAPRLVVRGSTSHPPRG